MSVEPKEGFDKWWWETGSGLVPIEGDDCEQHAERVSRVAWDVALKEEKILREALALVQRYANAGDQRTPPVEYWVRLARKTIEGV